LALTLFTAVFYGQTIRVLYPYLGRSFAIVVTVPMLLERASFGTRAGIFTGLLAFPVNLSLVILAGGNWNLWLQASGFLDHFVLLFVDTFAGYSRNLTCA